jgi:hypothetical protein
MRTLQLVSIFTLTVLLCSGCARDIGSVAKRHGVRVVQVEPRVNVNRALRFGYDTQSGELSATIASSIDNAWQARRLTALGTLMASNEIRLAALVREGVSSRLREVQTIELSTNEPQATLILSVEQHGFFGLGFKNSDYIPFIVIEGALVDRNGKYLWRANGQAHPIWDDHVSAKFDEYMARPELLREHWQHQIDLAAKRLLVGWDPRTLIIGSKEPAVHYATR